MPVVGVRREHLEAAFDEMRKHFGSLQGYFADGRQPEDTSVRRATIDFEEDRTLRAVLVGMLREADRER